MDISRLLEEYPRIRPVLPPQHKKIYVDEYKSNRTGKNTVQRLSQSVESWMHRQVSTGLADGDVLEIGAGTLNHLPYEENAGHYDVVEPFTELYTDSPYKDRVRKIYSDIVDVPKQPRYDRIISIAVLEHLEELPLTLAFSGLFLRPEGLFQSGIPSEGGLLWGLGWRCTTGLSYRIRTGLSYKTCMQHEHINSALEIIDLVQYFFTNVQITRFPFPLHHLSLYVHIHACKPDLQACQNYVRSRGFDFPKVSR